jgi:hypothetical protein
VRKLEDPVSVEPPRHGENPAECRACSAPDEAYIWVSERWRVRSLDRPTGLPMVLILESRSHLDLGDLPNMLAAELGVMTVRLERAIRSLDGVARVHVNRWGDGSAHLHVWFLARPYGRLQLRGTFLSLWDEILPPIPDTSWRENLALVAAWLAEFGGRPLAEPPRIDWKAPAQLTSPNFSVDDGGAVDGGAHDNRVEDDADQPVASGVEHEVPPAGELGGEEASEVHAPDESPDVVEEGERAGTVEPDWSGSEEPDDTRRVSQATEPVATGAVATGGAAAAAGVGVVVDAGPAVVIPAQAQVVEEVGVGAKGKSRRWRRR